MTYPCRWIVEHIKKGECKQHPASPVCDCARCIMLFVIYSVTYFSLNLCPQLGHHENNCAYFTEALLVMHSHAAIVGLSLHMSNATFTTYHDLLTEFKIRSVKKHLEM